MISLLRKVRDWLRRDTVKLRMFAEAENRKRATRKNAQAAREVKGAVDELHRTAKIDQTGEWDTSPGTRIEE